MNTLQKIQAYGDAHHPKWLDIMRIILGVILLLKGYYYIRNTGELQQTLLDNDWHLYNFVLIHVVAFAHLIGGLMIILGLVTRIAVLIQIPILLGAIIFVNAPAGLLTTNSELLLSIIVFFMLIFFFIYGSGPWSMDAYMESHKKDWESETPDL
jgi:uncharacterized membrane protein YphA (DoxX/SURF4 family)